METHFDLSSTGGEKKKEELINYSRSYSGGEREEEEEQSDESRYAIGQGVSCLAFQDGQGGQEEKESEEEKEKKGPAHQSVRRSGKTKKKGAGTKKVDERAISRRSGEKSLAKVRRGASSKGSTSRGQKRGRKRTKGLSFIGSGKRRRRGNKRRVGLPRDATSQATLYKSSGLTKSSPLGLYFHRSGV